MYGVAGAPSSLGGGGSVTKPRDHVTMSHMMSHTKRLFRDDTLHYSS